MKRTIFELTSIVSPAHRWYESKDWIRTFSIHQSETDQAPFWKIYSFELEAQRDNGKRNRDEETQEQRENRLETQRDKVIRKCPKESQEQHEDYRRGFRYSPGNNYTFSRCIQIGTISKICPYCKALKFNSETMGISCASGKAIFLQLAAIPEALKTLHTGTTS